MRIRKVMINVLSISQASNECQLEQSKAKQFFSKHKQYLEILDKSHSSSDNTPRKVRHKPTSAVHGKTNVKYGHLPLS